jgi:putative membrane protein
MKATKTLVGVLALALLVVTAGAQDKPMQDHDAHGKMTKDHMFMTEAAIGGMTEVRLGQLATERAASADVKMFGQHMVDDHGKANEELMSLASQKNVTLPTTLDAKHQAMVDKLSKLSGAEFDSAYMKEMVKDHEKDVSEFEKASKSAEDADLKAWAAKTLPTLRSHLQMARDVAGKAKGM